MIGIDLSAIKNLTMTSFFRIVFFSMNSLLWANGVFYFGGYFIVVHLFRLIFEEHGLAMVRWYFLKEAGVFNQLKIA